MHKQISDYEISHHDLYVRRIHEIEFWSILLGVIALMGVVFTVIFAGWVFSLFVESIKLF